jgi:hypothetical protein
MLDGVMNPTARRTEANSVLARRVTGARRHSSLTLWVQRRISSSMDFGTSHAGCSSLLKTMKALVGVSQSGSLNPRRSGSSACRGRRRITNAEAGWSKDHPPIPATPLVALVTAYRLRCEQADTGKSRSAGSDGAASAWGRLGTWCSSQPRMRTATFI